MACRELFGIDGEPFEFEWHISPGHTAVEILREIQTMAFRKTTPEEFEDRIIFSCLCLTTSIGLRMEITRNVFRCLRWSQVNAKKFPLGHWSFSRFW